MTETQPKPLVWYMAQAYAIRGGHEAHLLHFATELRNHGFDTRVMVLEALPCEEHAFMLQLRERGIPLSAVRRANAAWVSLTMAVVGPVWGLWMVLRRHRPRWDRLRNYIADIPARQILRRRLRREQPAVIHIMGCLAPYAWEVLPAERCVLHHGTEGRRDDTWESGDFEAFRAFAGRAAKNFAPGSGVIANLRREFGITRPIDSIFTICPDQVGATTAESRVPPPLRGGGVPSKAPGRSPGATLEIASAGTALRFGILCRLTPEKGISVLLEALCDYHQRYGALDFTIAGSGNLENDIRTFLAQHPLPGVRLITTFAAPTDVLRNLDVFVHPSISDAMPLAIAEALMCGLPCIVTKVGGIPDLVREGQEGKLIEPGAPVPIVDAMARFQAMPAAERLEFGRRARLRYEVACRPASVGTIIAAHYRSVMAGVEMAA